MGLILKCLLLKIIIIYTMKKILITFISLVLLGTISYAQIEVGTNNNIGIGTSGLVESKLSINTTGSSSWMGYIAGTNGTSGLVVKTGSLLASYSWSYGIYGVATELNGQNIGIYGNAYNSTAHNGRSYGVYGYGGNGSDGRNYGVYGKIAGTRSGAGICGTQYADAVINGTYAGYFYGNVKITGDLEVNGTFETSDINLKTQVRDIEKNNLAKIKKMRAIRFKYKMPEDKGMTDTSTTKVINPAVQEYYNRERIGFVAQELQEVYPELVKENQQGYLSVNYGGLIPILLEAINEQQETIETLISEVEKLKKTQH
jgi:hypothetical protein